MPNYKMARAMVSASQREKRYQVYLKTTAGGRRATREQFYKINYGVKPPSAKGKEIKATGLSRQSRGQLETLDEETYGDVMKQLRK
ncbi:MAG: hypothetical protein MUP81_04155 [Dehalococcoidia bacterium]|nr:hypothetical protein [Dehalococcoidia bacterium]